MGYWEDEEAKIRELLDEVRKAILAVCKNQSYRIGDVWYTRAELSSLRMLEQTLAERLDKIAGRVSTSYGRLKYE